MLDVSLFGLNPGRHHLVGVLLHAANAVLLFLLLLGLTDAPWRSLAAAAFFGLHPLRVESVAWASERKDVLAVFFLLLTLLAYRRHARRPGAATLAAALLLYVLALLCKPMPVTAPLMLLLLDWWPLNRPARPGLRSWIPLLLEKVPFLVPAGAAAAAALVGQLEAGAVVPLSRYPLSERLVNAFMSYASYPLKTVWPSGLALPYLPPRGADLSIADAVMALTALLAVTVAAVSIRRRAPYLSFGWLWYLGTLLPVSGVIQAGMQYMADRYTYIPSVGLLVMAVWGTADLARRWKKGPGALAAMTAAALAVLLLLSRRQTAFWRDTVTLHRHAITVMPGNWFPHFALGAIYGLAGDPQTAVREYGEASRLRPDLPEPHFKLGVLFVSVGDMAAAGRELDILRRMDRERAGRLEAFIAAAGGDVRAPAPP